jgi:hypothetical protein
MERKKGGRRRRYLSVEWIGAVTFAGMEVFCLWYRKLYDLEGSVLARGSWKATFIVVGLAF